METTQENEVSISSLFCSSPAVSGATLHDALYQRGVLIIEDSAVQRVELTALLHQLGITRIYEASDGAKALELLANLTVCPAAAILDLEMAGMDGIEFAQRLRNLRPQPALVIASRADTAIMEAVETMIGALGLPLLGAVGKPLGGPALATVLLRFRGDTGEAYAATDDGGYNPALPSQQQRVGGLAMQTRPLQFRPRISLHSGAVAAFEVVPRLYARVAGPASGPGVDGQARLSIDGHHHLLEHAARQASNWQGFANGHSLALTIPYAGLISHSLPDDLANSIRQSGLTPNRVTVQISQGCLTTEHPAVLASINRLRIYGFGLSLDDYCSGYSSIQWLSRLPFTEIKLEPEIISQSERGQQSRIILAAAIEMGHHLGLCTVADGVESESQLRMLQGMGCDRAQGPVVSGMLGAQEVPAWLLADAHRLHGLLRA